jgi:hypothetical protein
VNAAAPAVSVVLPFRNAVGTLAAAIDSLRYQTLSGFECILIDHQSADGSLSIARRYCATDPRFHIINHSGPFVDALNAGIAATKGPFVARMDADDLAAPRRLEAQHAMLVADPSLAIASCLVSCFPEEAVRDGMRRYVAWSNSIWSPDQIRQSLFVESPLVHPTVMMRRATLDQVGGYKASDGPEDYDLWLRLLLSGHLAAKVREVLLHWRDASTRLTRTDPHCSAPKIFATKLRYIPLVLPRGMAVQICGAGPIGRRWARALRRLGYPVQRFIDVDVKKQGRRIAGALVMAPERLDRNDGFVLAAVGVPGARAQIETYLQDRGLQPERDYLAVA